MIKKEVLGIAFDNIVNRDISPAIGFGETAEAYEYVNILMTLVLELKERAETEDLAMLHEWYDRFYKIREDLEKHR